MYRDQHGLEMTAAGEAAVRHYDTMLLHYLGLRQDTGDRLKEVFDADFPVPEPTHASRWISLDHHP